MIATFKNRREVLKNFVVFEGLDGAGTTTQLHLLEEKFRDSGVDCFITCEPTEHPIGKIIRNVLEKSAQVDPYTLAYLFAADRNEHLTSGDTGILKKLDEGAYVVTDRYLFSSLAYQSLHCGFDFVYSLNRYFPLPEHLFFIDVPVELCQERMEGRGGREIFDESEAQARILQLYEQSMEKYRETDMNIHRIDGRMKKEEIREKIWTSLGVESR